MDEKIKYTPEPWAIRSKRRTALTTNAIEIISKNPLPGHGETIAILGWGYVHCANSRNNAPLIIAAPDMYRGIRDALKFISILHERNDHGDPSLGTVELEKLESILEGCLEAIK